MIDDFWKNIPTHIRDRVEATKAASPFYPIVPKDPARNIDFRMEVMKLGYSNPKYAEELRVMCARDILFYVNTFGCVYEARSKVSKVLPCITWDFQDDLLLLFQACIEEGSDLGILKSRDMGVSWMVLYAFEHRWHFKPYESFLVSSRTQDYVDDTENPKALFWKLDFIHEFSPMWILPTGRWLGRKDKGRINNHLRNADTKSSIDGEATTANLGRGDRRTAILLDELAASIVGHDIDASTADTTNCRIINSTPQGTGNAFYSIYRSGRVPFIRLHWSKHPDKRAGMYKAKGHTVTLIDKEFRHPDGYGFVFDGRDRSPWYDAECRRRDRWQVAQEIDMDFEGSGSRFFDSKLIEHLRERSQPPRMRGDLVYDEFVMEATWRESSTGGLLLWEDLDYETSKPPDDRNYVVGCDIAVGVGGDYSTNSVASVFCTTTGLKVAEFATPSMSPRDFARYTVALSRFYNNAYLIWESNGPGIDFGKEIEEIGYSRIFYRLSTEIGRERKKTRKPGWHSSPEFKRQMLASYESALRDGKYVNLHDIALAEMNEYVYVTDRKIDHSRSLPGASPDPSGSGENHGDRVIADALCWRGVEELGAQPTLQKTKKLLESSGNPKLEEELLKRPPREQPKNSMARRMAAERERLAAAKDSDTVFS